MRCVKLLLAVILAVLAAPIPASASDHADPIDLFGLHPLDPVITDLFVFPADAEGVVITGSAENAAEIVIILCVRRSLTNTSTLDLTPYTYTVHIDTITKVDRSDAQTRLRYGGRIDKPQDIQSNIRLAIRLRNDASPAGEPVISGLLDPGAVTLTSGVFADPFVFPMFRNTNVVGMILRIPVACFDQSPNDFIVWATSKRGRKQIDHVGRSLRTQNPRFDLLNTLPPSRHVEAIEAERHHPSLMRDIALQARLTSLFGYREWDSEPDVLIYSRTDPVRFPNGRKLDDDVVKLAADYGDTLAYELSFFKDWPRVVPDPPAPYPHFPYLAARYDNPSLPDPPRLSTRNRLKLVAFGVGLLLLILLEHWFVARSYHRWRLRRRYQ